MLFRMPLVFFAFHRPDPCLFGCSNSKNEFDKLDWLAGRWENEHEGMKTIEIWERKNADEFQVKGLMLEGKDTVFSESINVAPKLGTIFYTVTISDQNNGKPVAFKLTENTGNRACFRKPEARFPAENHLRKNSRRFRPGKHRRRTKR